jgi:tape measure domain-containing protein
MASSIGTAWIQIKPSLTGISKDIEEQLGSEIDKSLNKSSGAFNKFSTHSVAALDKIGKSGFGALSIVAAGAMAFIGSRIDNAVARIDTLLNFPRVLEAMGATSLDAKAATDKLSRSLKGLPTALQDGANGVQRFVVAGLSTSKSTDAFLALNNALIASGAGAGQVESAMLALTQSLSRGKFDGEEWNSLLATMPAAFGALQKATGKSTNELKDMFRLDPKGLIDRIIQLNTTGGAGFDSLDVQARAATGGIGTAFSNLGNAVDRGWQSIVASIGGGDLEAGAKKISDSIGLLGTNIEKTMKSVGEWINNNGSLINNVIIPALEGVAVVLGLLVVRFVLLALLNPVNQIIIGLLLLGAVIGVVVANWDTITAVVGSFFAGVGGWISNALATVSNFFNSILKYVSQVFETIGNVLQKTFDSIVAFFMPAVQVFTQVFGIIFRIVSGIFILIVALLATMAQFIFERTLQPIINSFVTAFNFISELLQSWINTAISIITPIVAWIWSNVLQPIIGFFTTAFNIMANAIGEFSNAAKNVFLGIVGWIGNNIINPIAGFFTGLWNGIIGGVIGAVKGVSDAMGTVLGAVKGPLNFIIDQINKLIDGINKVKVPDWVPGLGGLSPNLPKLPRFYTGGQVMGPGTATSDSIAASLSNGEYVIRAAAAQKIGYSNLDALNSTGEVQTGGDSFEININGYNKDPRELADEISNIIARKRKRVMG